jgi:hypothetical protein
MPLPRSAGVSADFPWHLSSRPRSALLATRGISASDRDRPGHYVSIVEFDSYEEAMRNSNDPATAKYARQMGELLDAPPTHYNLDVRQVKEPNR